MPNFLPIVYTVAVNDGFDIVMLVSLAPPLNFPENSISLGIEKEILVSALILVVIDFVHPSSTTKSSPAASTNFR